MLHRGNVYAITEGDYIRDGKSESAGKIALYLFLDYNDSILVYVIMQSVIMRNAIYTGGVHFAGYSWTKLPRAIGIAYTTNSFANCWFKQYNVRGEIKELSLRFTRSGFRDSHPEFPSESAFRSGATISCTYTYTVLYITLYIKIYIKKKRINLQERENIFSRVYFHLAFCISTVLLLSLSRYFILKPLLISKQFNDYYKR